MPWDYLRFQKLERGMQEITHRWCRTTLQRTERLYLESREWDAFGHCWIACEGTRVCGEYTTGMAGSFRELIREAGFGGRHDSLSQDLRNQALGRELSNFAGRPSMLCDRAYRQRRFDLTAPLTRTRFSLARGIHTV